jgi:hypothetical protein
MKGIRGLFAVIVLAAGLFAQTENYAGWGDTSVLTTFRADSLKYSRAFLLSQYENLRVDFMVNDTDAAGFVSDSVKAYWGIQTGHPCLNSSGVVDTVWNHDLVIADTIDLLTTTNAGPKYFAMDSAGNYANTRKSIDTTNVTGFAVQSRNISPYWDVYVRCFAKGLTGNNKGSMLSARFALYRRVGQNTRSR